MKQDLDERTEFEVANENPFRTIVKNIGKDNLKLFSVLVFLSSVALRGLKVINNTYMYIGFGISLVLLFLVGVGESAKVGGIKELEAKNIILRELWAKKREGSNEFDLTKGVPEMTGECKKWNIEGKPVEWHVGWVLKKYSGRIIQYASAVEFATGNINEFGRRVTGFSIRDQPDIIRKIPGEFWDWYKTIRKSARGEN